MEITFDPSDFIKTITELQKVQIPRAGAIALNKAAFEARKELSRQTEKRFYRPVPLTQNAFNYDKATEDKLQARVYVRDWITKGNSPSRYLGPQIFGTQMYRTRFQKALGYTPNPDDGSPILAPNRVMIPTASPMVRRNKYVNMSPGQYTQILSSLRGESSAGNKIAKPGKGRNKSSARYFYISQEMLDDQYRNLKSQTPGIFLSQNGRLNKVMTESRLPSYNPRFPFFDIARTTFEMQFARTFSSLVLR